jgi:hypothetical protein
MLTNTRLQMIAMLAAGGLLGYAAASGNLDVFHKANAERSPSAVSEKTRSPGQGAAACCPESRRK